MRIPDPETIPFLKRLAEFSTTWFRGGVTRPALSDISQIRRREKDLRVALSSGRGETAASAFALPGKIDLSGGIREDRKVINDERGIRSRIKNGLALCARYMFMLATGGIPTSAEC